MQPLNHDMDELMRRAAENYPVKPQGADWEKVAQQLEASSTTVVPASKQDGLKKSLLFLLFFLSGFVCDRFFITQHGSLKKLEATAAPALQNATSAPSLVARPSARVTMQNNAVPLKLVSKRTSRSVMSKPALEDHQPLPITGDTEAGDRSYATAAVFQNPIPVFAEERVVTTPLPLQHQVVVEVHLPTPPGHVLSKQKKAIVPLDKTYISLMMGPDITRVKGQHAKPPGYTLGLLAGHRFSRRIAVEAGLLWDKKNYYSNGEYFKTDKINLPRHSEVVWVDGFCAMFELPLHLRYDVVKQPRHTLTAGVGATSFLMKKEDYDYVYRRYNQDYAGNAKYNHASMNWFSSADLSLGYEYRLATQTKIRIEPYLKLPLKGVGIGSLPLRSAGLMVGLTRVIH